MGRRVAGASGVQHARGQPTLIGQPITVGWFALRKLRSTTKMPEKGARVPSARASGGEPFSTKCSGHVTGRGAEDGRVRGFAGGSPGGQSLL